MFRCRACLSPVAAATQRETYALHIGDVNHRPVVEGGSPRWESGSSAWCGLGDDLSNENCFYITGEVYKYHDRIGFIYWSKN